MLAVPRFPSAQLGPDRYFLIAPLLRGPPPALRPRPRAVLGAGLAGKGGGGASPTTQRAISLALTAGVVEALSPFSPSP